MENGSSSKLANFRGDRVHWGYFRGGGITPEIRKNDRVKEMAQTENVNMLHMCAF